MIVDATLDRGVKLDLLESKADTMVGEAVRFKKTASLVLLCRFLV